MENKISLTALLIDIRSRNLVHMSQEDITQSLNERGYSDSLSDVKAKMQTLGRLYYITIPPFEINHSSEVSQVLHTAFLEVVRPHHTQPVNDVWSVGLTSL